MYAHQLRIVLRQTAPSRTLVPGGGGRQRKEEEERERGPHTHTRTPRAMPTHPRHEAYEEGVVGMKGDGDDDDDGGGDPVSSFGVGPGDGGGWEEEREAGE